MPVVGNIPEFRKDPVRFISRVVREFGDVTRIDLARSAFVVNHPDGVKRVLHDNHTNYKKNFIYDRLRPLLGNGLLTSNGDFWLRQRRLAQPAFHRPRMSSFVELMVRHTHRMLERWDVYARDGRVFDLHAEMTRLTLVIVGDSLFSIDLDRGAVQAGHALTDAIAVIGERFTSLAPSPLVLPTPSNRRLGRAIDSLNAIVAEIIGTRRRSGETSGDLLGMLMETRDADTGETMDDQQLRDEVMTLVLAGHETTASGVSFAVYLLSKHPEIARRLALDVGSVLGGEPPTFDRLPSMRSVSQVSDEALRLYPPLWIIAREALDDDEIGGYHIPKGANVILVPYTTHRHKDFWENPEGFDPDRFTPESAKQRHRYAFFPFAAGPRMCLGSHFAVMEMQIILSMVVQRFRLDLAPHYPFDLDAAVTLRPARGVMVTAHRM